jgi:hypothetical protein
MRSDILPKLERLKLNPRAELEVHPLHGILDEK